MKLLVPGGAGMLGRDVARVASAAGHEVVALTREGLDVTDAAAVAERVAAEAPDAVLNCAAYTNVDGAEADLRSAMEGNAEAARHVAAAAAAAGAAVLYPSTDYVFDGTKREPYVESDPTRPQTVYGQSKLAGEHETASANPRHVIARTSWLFGTGGRNFVETMLRLAGEHAEVTVVRDQVGCPTYTPHLAEALVALLAAESYGVHHVAARGECSWYEFAREIFRQAPVECRVESTTSAEFRRPAPRPAYSVLVSERDDAVLLPAWEMGLADYLAERAAVA
ncbi:MAG: dTDP-4-dehydrorhamnose reductase [Thermoleophilaceae bacterium]